MRTIITDIRQHDSAEEFSVDMLLDGVEKSFRFRVVQPDLTSVEPMDNEFLNIFQYSMVPRAIARFVVGAYRGESASFPVDFSDIRPG